MKSKRLREVILSYITGDIGNIFESKDKVICSLDDSVLDNNKVFYLHNLDEKKRKLIYKNNMNKEYTYIISGHDFDDDVVILGYNGCKVLIKDCRFNSLAVHIYDGNCTLENVIVDSKRDNVYISADNVSVKDSLVIKQDNVSALDLCINGKDSIHMDNSLIGRRGSGFNVTLNTKDLRIKSTNINSTNLLLNAY